MLGLGINQDEILAYEHRGRESIVTLAKSMVALAYRGDFTEMESRLAKPDERQAMQLAFKAWQDSQKS